jgi:transcriptional regulator with XRE-family HTH domain
MKRIRLRLRECLDDHTRRTGRELSYRELSARSGVSVDTLKSMATRSSYSPSIRTIERVAAALGVDPLDLLTVVRR